MKKTSNLNLNVPELTDSANITPLSENMEILDQVILTKEEVQKVYEVTLTKIWVDKAQEIELEGMTPNLSPSITCKLPIDEPDTWDGIKEEWSKVVNIVTGTDKLTVYCKEETTKPITLLVKGV